MLLLCDDGKAAGLDVYGRGGYGYSIDPIKGDRDVMFLAIDAPIITSADSDYCLTGRTVYKQQTESTVDAEQQSAELWNVHSVRLLNRPNLELYIRGAFGFQNTFNPGGDDPLRMALKVEPAIKIIRRLELVTITVLR